MSAPWYSSVSADDWAPIHDVLLQGVVHACNNRVAALGGITQLQEHKLATSEEGFASLKTEVGRFRDLMQLMRSLLMRKGDKQEPARMGESVQSAMALLFHHPVARQWTFSVSDEAADAMPVLLWPSDPLRFAVLLLLAAGADAPSGELRVVVMRDGRHTVTAVVANGEVSTVSGHHAYAALKRAAEREKGTVRVRSYGGPGSIEVALSLPALRA